MIIGTYSGGSASAYEYSTLPELLSQLPDNTANQIDAINVRNSVYTLWERISDVQMVASQSASASSIYTNLNPTPYAVGGIQSGSTFSNQTMQQMWDALLYPYVAPGASLGGGFYREFGDSNVLTLSWSATKNSKSITSIFVDGVPKVVTGNNQSGTQTATSTQNSNTIFYMTVSDIPNGTSNITVTTTSTWDNRRYWGTLPSGHPLTTVSSLPFSASASLTGLSSELGSGYVQTRTITTNYDYVVFVWPHSSVDLSTTPTHVKIGGFGNNNWIKTRNNVQFTNQFGYSGTNYDVWVFGNTQAPNTFSYEIT